MSKTLFAPTDKAPHVDQVSEDLEGLRQKVNELPAVAPEPQWPYSVTDKEFGYADVVEGFQLNAHQSHAVKYILRLDRKPGVDPIEDIDKAIWWMYRERQRRIDARKKAQEAPSTTAMAERFAKR